LTPDQREHSRLRRAFTQVFKQSALAAQEPILAYHIERFLRELEVAQASSINIRDLYFTFTFDVMSDLIFGTPLDFLDGQSDKAWVESLWGYTKAIAILAILSKLPLLKIIFRLLSRLTMPYYYDFLRSTVVKLDRRLSGAHYRNDILHFFQDSERGSDFLVRKLTAL